MQESDGLFSLSFPRSLNFALKTYPSYFFTKTILNRIAGLPEYFKTGIKMCS